MQTGADGIAVQAGSYRLTLGGGVARLADRDGRLWAELATVFSLDGLDTRDETSAHFAPQVEEDASGCRIRLTSASTRWRSKELTLVCRDDALELHGEVTGEGELADCWLLGGWIAASGRDDHHAGEHRGWRSSRPSFATVFSPEPRAPRRWAYAADASTSIDVWSEPHPGTGHWFFTPPPFCYALSRAEPVAEWGEVPGGPVLAMGLATAPGEHNFSGFHYEGTPEGFCVRLTYDGQTHVEGTFRTPALVFLFGAADPYEAIARHTAALRARALVDLPGKSTADWWRRPIFCGWGQQCYLAHVAAGDRPRYWLTAPDFSRQHHYDRFIEVLAAEGLNAGTVVVDDKWQHQYARAEPDPAKWPDLKGWITRRHETGQRVLLWWNAWGWEGLPPEETIRDREGRSVTCDPSNPAYRSRLEAIVRRMLAPDELDADGLKVDFTASTPHGPGFSRHGREWGVELLRLLIATIHGSAKRAKSDALVVTHAPNPYFGTVTDMIRLNDIARLEDAADVAEAGGIVPEMTHRANVARAACPELLLDTDNWPCANRAQWREYLAVQRTLGVPALYYATHLDVTCEPLEPTDYAAVRASWAESAAT